MSIQCFWLEETMRAKRYLRRYASREHYSGDNCPINGYHDAMVLIDEIPFTKKPLKVDEDYLVSDFSGKNDEKLFEGDARWPKACACGYVFLDTDRWQVFTDVILRRADTGDEMTQREAPAGAMWDAWWYGSDGFDTNPNRPDKLHVMLRTPGGDWYVDGKSRQGGFWTRTGDPRALPPTISAQPSILAEPYHGWLRAGKLETA